MRAPDARIPARLDGPDAILRKARSRAVARRIRINVHHHRRNDATRNPATARSVDTNETTTVGDDAWNPRSQDRATRFRVHRPLPTIHGPLPPQVIRLLRWCPSPT